MIIITVQDWATRKSYLTLSLPTVLFGDVIADCNRRRSLALVHQVLGIYKTILKGKNYKNKILENVEASYDMMRFNVKKKCGTEKTYKSENWQLKS